MKRVSYTAVEVEALIMGALAGARPMTPEERESQRRSFVYGNVKLHNPEVTREMVDEVGDELAAAPAKRWVDSWWAVPVALLVIAAFFAVVYSVAPNGADAHVEVAK